MVLFAMQCECYNLFLLCIVAGVCGGKLVEAHGSFNTASCIKCKTKHDATEVKVWNILFIGYVMYRFHHLLHQTLG